MFQIGMRPGQGIFTKTEMKRGKIPQVGTRGANAVNGDVREYVVVQLGATVWQNGTVLQIDGGGTLGVATTASGNPTVASHGRLGVLVIGTATTTITAVGTSYAWAQIYGQVKALASASVTAAGIQLGLGTGPGALIQSVAQVSASAAAVGFVSMGTQTTAGLLDVLLQYPRWSGFPDANLA